MSDKLYTVFYALFFTHMHAHTLLTFCRFVKYIEKLEDLILLVILLVVEENVVIITQLICLTANHGKKSREIAKMSTSQCYFVCLLLCDISACRQYAHADAQLHHDNLCKPTII